MPNDHISDNKRRGLSYLALWAVVISFLFFGFVGDIGITAAIQENRTMFYSVSSISILLFTLAIYYLYLHFTQQRQH